jgi:methylmalonyl-CoA mutase N-terminal domain/subunit
VLAHETDLTATVDPFAGSYAIESMTGDIERAAADLIGRVEELGGAVEAIERGFQKAEIEESAYRVARQIEDGERVVVGVNRFAAAAAEPYHPLHVDLAIEEQQAKRLARLRESRDPAEWQHRIDDIKRAAEGSRNVLVPLREALRARATVGEVCDALRTVWGTYQPSGIS